jgi:MFS family permease
MPDDLTIRASRVRFGVIGVSIAMAFILYLDRVCLGEIIKNEAFREEFGASKERLGKVLGAFFFTYALFQVPAGWASDRFGARRMLPLYIVLWSLTNCVQRQGSPGGLRPSVAYW